jgi:hypothetical protein
LANLPKQIVVTWPHHELFGRELPLHGWRHIEDEIHLKVTLADGSVGCLPASWTNLFGRSVPISALKLYAASIRDLREVLDPLAARTKQGRARRPKAK